MIAMECFGHRGGTGIDYPENSMASFEAALAGGVDGIETDVRYLKDGVVCLHHDAAFGHTVNASGNLVDWSWQNGVERLRLKSDMTQTIPRLEELLALLMRREYSHVRLNIDAKPQNPASTLFKAIHAKVVEAGGERYIETLGHRIILSLYSDVHLAAAERDMPYARRSQLGADLAKARELFGRVDSFSMSFSNLALPGGEKFVKECKAAGKAVAVWTVNTPYEWLECARLGVDIIITDHLVEFRAWQKRVESDERALKRMASTKSSLSALQMVYELYRAFDDVTWQRAMIKDAYKDVPVVQTPRLSPKFIAVAFFGNGKRLGEPEALVI